MIQIQKDQATADLRRIPFVVELSANRNEVQRIDLGDISTADTFTLTFDGQTTGSITYNATPATLAGNIQTALEALSNVASTEATVAHVSAAIFSVTFSGALAAQTFNVMTVNSPTTFTPGSVTKYVVGGVANAPALGETFSTSDIQLSKNGGTLANNAGSFVEIGKGGYYYIPTTGEVDTQGFLFGVLNKAGLAVSTFVAQIIPLSTVEGETVIATGTAQSGDANTIRLASGASSTSNYYTPCRVDITSGTGSGQGGRFGYSYNGTTKDLSVEPPFVTVPDSSSVYKLVSIAPNAFDTYRANHLVSGTFGGDLSEPADIVDEIIARGDELATEFFDLTSGIETSLTLRQALRLIVAASAGKLSGGATTTVTIRDIADTKNRIVATVDADGNRSTITTDLT